MLGVRSPRVCGYKCSLFTLWKDVSRVKCRLQKRRIGSRHHSHKTGISRSKDHRIGRQTRQIGGLIITPSGSGSPTERSKKKPTCGPNFYFLLSGFQLSTSSTFSTSRNFVSNRCITIHRIRDKSVSNRIRRLSHASTRPRNAHFHIAHRHRGISTRLLYRLNYTVRTERENIHHGRLQWASHA